MVPAKAPQAVLARLADRSGRKSLPPPLWTAPGAAFEQTRNESGSDRTAWPMTASLPASKYVLPRARPRCGDSAAAGITARARDTSCRVVRVVTEPGATQTDRRQLDAGRPHPMPLHAPPSDTVELAGRAHAVNSGLPRLGSQDTVSRTGSVSTRRAAREDLIAAALAHGLGAQVAADHEDERRDLEQDALPGRVDAEPQPDQYGSSTSIGVIGSQPVPCIVRAVLPTITTSTKPISTPVTISIFL